HGDRARAARLAEPDRPHHRRHRHRCPGDCCQWTTRSHHAYFSIRRRWRLLRSITGRHAFASVDQPALLSPWTADFRPLRSPESGKLDRPFRKVDGPEAVAWSSQLSALSSQLSALSSQLSALSSQLSALSES